MVRGSGTARPSNCGEFLRAFATVLQWKHCTVHQGNDLGHGKNAKDWIIRSQVLSASQEAYECSSTTKWWSAGEKSLWLKIESGPPEMESKDERPNQPRALEGSNIILIIL